MLKDIASYGPGSLLVKVLRHAVPRCPVQEVLIAHRQYMGGYVAAVFPLGLEYWEKFMKKYPQWKTTGKKYNVKYLELLEALQFFDLNDFLMWLGKTVDRTGTTAKLLILTKGR